MKEIKSERQRRLLGVSFGSACNKLRKLLLFKLATDAGRTMCHRCGEQIATLDEFSIEHKASWERAADPLVAFFNLENIAFSHLTCNVGAASKPHKRFNSRKESHAFHNAISNSRRTPEQRRPEYEPARRRARYLRTGH